MDPRIYERWPWHDRRARRNFECITHKFRKCKTLRRPQPYIESKQTPQWYVYDKKAMLTKHLECLKTNDRSVVGDNESIVKFRDERRATE